jgi:hypothetical protein
MVDLRRILWVPVSWAYTLATEAALLPHLAQMNQNEQVRLVHGPEVTSAGGRQRHPAMRHLMHPDDPCRYRGHACFRRTRGSDGYSTGRHVSADPIAHAGPPR